MATRVKVTNGFGGTVSNFQNKEGTVLGQDDDGWYDVLLDNFKHLGPVPFYARELTTLGEED